MGRNVNDIVRSLPSERKLKIKKLAQKKVEEMIAVADVTAAFRVTDDKTQVDKAAS